MKKLLIGSVIMLVLVSGCGCKNKGKKENLKKSPYTVNYDIPDSEVVDGIKIESISLITDSDGVSKFSAYVINTNKETYKLEYIKIILKDKKDKEIQTLVGYTGSNLEPNDMKYIESSTEADLSKVVNVKFDITH